MNYYEHHIGDYIRDTVGLTMLEDGAYRRLLDQLYQTEKPLPLDRKEVYRMARATSAAERKAVDYVVSKFFEKTDEGYSQKRAMEILAEYWDRPEQAEKKNTKEGNRERQRRSRERRKALFEALAGHGIVPPYNTPMRDLEAMLEPYLSQERRDMSQPVTRDSVTPVMAPVMGNHSPLPTTQKKTVGESTVISEPLVSQATIPNPPTSEAHWASHFRQRHGFEVNPSSVHDRRKAWPIFAGWVNAGLTIERVDAAVAQAIAQATEPIAYLPGYVDRVIASQAAQKPSAAAARDQERADVIATLTGRKPAHERTAEAIDVAARRID